MRLKLETEKVKGKKTGLAHYGKTVNEIIFLGRK
jgi:hypothetical protein